MNSFFMNFVSEGQPDSEFVSQIINNSSRGLLTLKRQEEIKNNHVFFGNFSLCYLC